MSHPLDRPVWSALHSRQAHLAIGEAVRRFPVDVSPLAAAGDGSEAAAPALAALIPEGDDISLLEAAPPRAPAGMAAIQAACLQMTLSAFPPDEQGAKIAAMIQPLGEADAPEMLELALLTRPGPFRKRTHTLGRFIGIRDRGRLAAMAGERLKLDGFTEISAICTHPDFRGRGYGEALTRAVGRRILDEGDTPFLHSYAANTGAVALYRRLGFEVRREVVHAVWKRA